MAMSVGPGSEGDEPGVMANINTTPLVDVMLVLLIIFLITIPVINKTVKVELPKAVNIPTQTKPENITVAIDKNGTVYWNDRQIASRQQLLDQVKAAAVVKPQPEIHIRADRGAGGFPAAATLPLPYGNSPRAVPCSRRASCSI